MDENHLELEGARMAVSNELPAKCQECAKSAISIIHDKCNFCRDLAFPEEVLCHLNRCIQDPADFACHAFRPILKLAGSPGTKVSGLAGGSKGLFKKESFLRLLRSEKIKYKEAFAFQKLERDPDEVILELKYHLAWNVIHRKSVFRSNNDVFHFARDTFWGCSELVGGFVNLLWLAPDHVHLYVETSTADKSVETIVKQIKRYSNKALLDRFVDLRERVGKENELWDIAYFTETVG